VSGSTFYAVFIFFILILTIIFTHYLIRLCMLAIKPQKPYKCRRARDRTQWPSDEEAALTQHAEPVLIVLATDDRANFGAERTVEDTPEDEEGSEKDLPPPPPVYGNWRGSGK